MSDAVYVLTQFRRDRRANLKRTLSLVKDTLHVPCMLVASANCDSAATWCGSEIIRFGGANRLPMRSSFRRPSTWDIGDKRFGIHQHARARGFGVISMIDDDIVVTRDDLCRHMELIERHDIVSSVIEHFPDNSIFFHATRVLRRKQHANPSGSLLSVRLKATANAFFNVYNEDWFFFFLNSDVRHASTFSVKQMPYDPFRDPRLAAWQEPFDLIAEGLRESGGTLFAEAAVNDAFWEIEIAQRSAAYEAMLEMRAEAPIVACLQAGQTELARISPSFCTAFCASLRQAVEEDYRVAV